MISRLSGTPGTVWDGYKNVPPRNLTDAGGQVGRDGTPPYKGVPVVPPPADVAADTKAPFFTSPPHLGARGRDKPSKGAVPADARQGLTESQLLEFEERAAVREFDGGLSRAAAERLALLDLQTAALA